MIGRERAHGLGSLWFDLEGKGPMGWVVCGLIWKGKGKGLGSLWFDLEGKWPISLVVCGLIRK